MRALPVFSASSIIRFALATILQSSAVTNSASATFSDCRAIITDCGRQWWKCRRRADFENPNRSSTDLTGSPDNKARLTLRSLPARHTLHRTAISVARAVTEAALFGSPTAEFDAASSDGDFL